MLFLLLVWRIEYSLHSAANFILNFIQPSRKVLDTYKMSTFVIFQKFLLLCTACNRLPRTIFILIRRYYWLIFTYKSLLRLPVGLNFLTYFCRTAQLQYFTIIKNRHHQTFTFSFDYTMNSLSGEMKPNVFELVRLSINWDSQRVIVSTATNI